MTPKEEAKELVALIEAELLLSFNDVDRAIVVKKSQEIESLLDKIPKELAALALARVSAIFTYKNS